MKNLAGLLGLDRQRGEQRRPRLRIDMAGAVVYAVGDIHGCLDALLALEQRIVADAQRFPEPKLIIMLGDYVDRGPASAQAIDHLIARPPTGFERICLTGNHELVMLDYLEGRSGISEWVRLGARSTLLSYGIDLDRLASIYQPREIDDLIRRSIPATHFGFLRSLPILIEAQPFLFVHAGVRPGVELDDQSDEDLVTIRSAFHDQAHLLDRIVVHGHTPVSEAKLEGRRVNIDTGAYMTGRLTAVRIRNGKGKFLTIEEKASPIPSP